MARMAGEFKEIRAAAEMANKLVWILCTNSLIFGLMIVL